MFNFKLTPRERQIFILRACGCQIKEIAYEFGLSENTVKVYSARAYALHADIAKCQNELALFVLMEELLKSGDLAYANKRLEESPLHKLLNIVQTVKENAITEARNQRSIHRGGETGTGLESPRQ